MVRAKVGTLAARDPALPDGDRRGARTSARNHVLLAAIAAAEGDGPRWLLLCGPPASGKSALAARLAAASGWPHLATDAVRKELAGVQPTARARTEHYSAAFSDRTYRELLARAQGATAGGEPGVLLDGNFPTAARRAQAMAAARSVGAVLLCLHVQVDAATARQRASARTGDPAAISDADASVAERLRAAFEPPSAAEGTSVLDLDGTRPIDELLEQVLVRLLVPGTA
jgi:predicted kinase